ncbi:MAG: DNA polymerase I, partial [Solirubrobacterales bacterium]|nr:DNA polymerase I [Solirubrobacterales bacterium]
MADELLLIDGNSLAYRAFFALPESIATSTGMPTNAIFGLASMLVKLLSEYGQKPTVVVWDGGYTGRKEIYPEYKAQRSSRPDLLKEQWPHFEPLIEAFGYQNLRVDGYEADDVIASIAASASKAGGGAIPVLVLTGDRDAFQLVDEHTRILAPGRGITDTKLYDRDGVISRYGITPEQVPDFIGLKGDSSDNIPGVPGIGDKTAADLLQRFGTVEGVLDNIDQISGAKRKQNLEEHADDARISKQLAINKRDIPVELDLDSLMASEPDRSTLRETFRRFELR